MSTLFDTEPEAPAAPRVYHLRGWLPRADEALGYLRWRIRWEHREFRPGVPMPRLEALFGPEGQGYQYSGVEYLCTPLAGHPVERLVDKVNAELGTRFNAAFCNLYRDGRDSIGWHADDEPVLGPPEDIEIASLSLGQPRRFLMRRRVADRKFDRREWTLGNGDLLFMRAGCQAGGWEHSAPKEDGVEGVRIALTFRRFV